MNNAEEIIKADFHTHTCYSKDSLLSPHSLISAARKHGFDRIAITDHNSIQGALEAQRLDPHLIIIGEEIKTLEGEILAIFVKEEVPANLPPLEAIRILKAQGAFISLSHPFDTCRSGWSLQTLEIITPLLDAIEIFNARCLQDKFNQQAEEFARLHRLAGTCGSDSHTAAETGICYQRLPVFSTPDELRKSLQTSTIHGTRSTFSAHLHSSYARFFKQIKKQPKRNA